MIHIGDCRQILRALPEASVQCCVTSPPYFGLRDYDESEQIGLEATPEEYVATLVEVFRAVRRVLRDDGTLWLNLGDTYASNGGPGWQGKSGERSGRRFTGTRNSVAMRRQARTAFAGNKPKDLIGIPWMVAFALRADGWYLRQDIIWAKPNAMPESVGDRCTKSHEYLFLLTKSRRYYYDAAAIAEPVTAATNRDRVDTGRFRPDRGFPGSNSAGGGRLGDKGTRNKRSVWVVATTPFKEAHFATFPKRLIEPCILAGSRLDDLVLDPFMGAGTTGVVCEQLGRRWLGCEISAKYAAIAERRMRASQPGLALSTSDLPEVANG